MRYVNISRGSLGTSSRTDNVNGQEYVYIKHLLKHCLDKQDRKFELKTKTCYKVLFDFPRCKMKNRIARKVINPKNVEILRQKKGLIRVIINQYVISLEIKKSAF